jgi:predicted dehydrogenase
VVTAQLGLEVGAVDLLSGGMSSRVLRIGIIGAGANTRAKHLPLLQRIPGVQVVLVANRSVASTQAVAREFGIPGIARHWREVVAAPDVDAIVIGTWPYLHAEATCAALAMGKHVLTEARMAAQLVQAETMAAAANARPELVAQIVPAPMSLDFDAAISALLPQLGCLREVCVVHTGGQFADAAAALSWRQEFALSGVNTLTLGINYEMVLRWLGEDPVWVQADAAVFTPRRSRAEGGVGDVGIPESVSVLGRYRSGARLVMHFSGVEIGQARHEIRLNGEHGSLRLDLIAQKLWHTSLGGMETCVEPTPGQRRGWRVEEDFVASIREGLPVRLTDFATGVRYMRLTDAVWRSWSDGGGRVVV